MPRAAFTTLGCKVNQYDTLTVEGLFKKHGYEVVDFEDVADVYVINTCVVTNIGEKKSRQIIHRAVRNNPDAFIVVMGCYAQTAPEKVKKIDGVDLIIGNQERHRIVELVEQAKTDKTKLAVVKDIMHSYEFEDIELFDMPERTRAFLKIQEGCNNFCTYCIIPYARGPLRSRSLDSIKKEAVKLVNAGYKEIVFTGIHLGAFGHSEHGKVTLTDAVKTVLDIEGLVRLRLGSLESIEVSPELIDIMKQDKRLCSHLHLPLQAGSNEVLKMMNRAYSIDEYFNLVKGIKKQIPDIAITTDIIVGFPGETEKNFIDSLGFIKDIGFARIHVFPYSRRSGTPAADYPQQVPEEEKKVRAKELAQLGDYCAKSFYEKFIGTKREVLLETCHNGIVDGLTDNYMRVYLEGDSNILGQVKIIQLDKQYKDGLWGFV